MNMSRVSTLAEPEVGAWRRGSGLARLRQRLGVAGLLIALGCVSISDEALEAAQRGCDRMADELAREDMTGLLSSPLVLREAHAVVEPDVGLEEFAAATHEVCPDTLLEMEQRLEQLAR